MDDDQIRREIERSKQQVQNVIQSVHVPKKAPKATTTQTQTRTRKRVLIILAIFIILLSSITISIHLSKTILDYTISTLCLAWPWSILATTFLTEKCPSPPPNLDTEFAENLYLVGPGIRAVLDSHARDFETINFPLTQSQLPNVHALSLALQEESSNLRLLAGDLHLPNSLALHLSNLTVDKPWPINWFFSHQYHRYLRLGVRLYDNVLVRTQLLVNETQALEEQTQELILEIEEYMRLGTRAKRTLYGDGGKGGKRTIGFDQVYGRAMIARLKETEVMLKELGMFVEKIRFWMVLYADVRPDMSLHRVLLREKLVYWCDAFMLERKRREREWRERERENQRRGVDGFWILLFGAPVLFLVFSLR